MTKKEHPRLSQLELPYYILAGGLAGSVADIMMHGVDTIKTRTQGQLALSSLQKKPYTGILQSFRLIIKQEGIRGLYGGFLSASIGSMLSTSIHFGVYEYTKQNLIAYGIEPTISYLAAGALGDIFASITYVPSEVLKTRLQLQGTYNNPYSLSQHNYKGNLHAIRSLFSSRGIFGLYRGWSATMVRDIPFTAMQFAFYETFKTMILKYRVHGQAQDVTVLDDIAAGVSAGTLAGFITTPLDVVKTYLQTQKRHTRPKKGSPFVKEAESQARTYYTGFISAFVGIYKQSGIKGLFYGVGPRMFWTGCQSMFMFVLYEHFLDMIRYAKIHKTLTYE